MQDVAALQILAEYVGMVRTGPERDRLTSDIIMGSLTEDKCKTFEQTADRWQSA